MCEKTRENDKFITLSQPADVFLVVDIFPQITLRYLLHRRVMRNITHI